MSLASRLFVVANSEPNKLFPNQRGFPTPNAAPDETACRVFSIPADEEWLALVMGACEALTHEWAWYQNGTLTPAEAAAAMTDIISDAYAQAETGVCETEVETPFWDDASDVGDNEPTDTQEWYGQVANPTAPADELDFVENIVVWTFTGLLALATPELGFAPAILFHTIAPKFIVAQKRGDIATVIRIVLDGEDMATVDTSSYSAGDIIEIPVLGEESEDGHDLLVLNYLP